MAKRRKTKPGEAFRFENGEIAETKTQLIAALKKMPDSEFSRYVNENKNDFYTWLHDCLDGDLAECIRGIRDKGEIVRVLKG